MRSGWKTWDVEQHLPTITSNVGCHITEYRGQNKPGVRRIDLVEIDRHREGKREDKDTDMVIFDLCKSFDARVSEKTRL